MMNDTLRKEYTSILEDIQYHMEELLEDMKAGVETENEAYYQAEQYYSKANDTYFSYAHPIESDEELSSRGARLVDIAQDEYNVADEVYEAIVNKHFIDLEELVAKVKKFKLSEKARKAPRKASCFKEGKTYYAVSSIKGTDESQWSKVRIVERTGNKMLVSEFVDHRNFWTEPKTVYVEKSNRGNETAKFDMFSTLDSMREAESVNTKAAPTSQVTLNRKHF